MFSSLEQPVGLEVSCEGIFGYVHYLSSNCIKRMP